MRSNRFITFIILFLTAFQLAAVDIVCTTYPVWLLVRELTNGVQKVRLDLMMPHNSGCAHSYTPGMRDSNKVNKDKVLLICNGMDLDEHIVKAALHVNRKLQVVRASEATVNGDAHSFASPDTALRMTENIFQALCKHDPDNSKAYQKNFLELSKDFEQLLKQAEAIRSFQPEIAAQYHIFSNLAKLLGCNVIFLKNEKDDQITVKAYTNLLKWNRRQKNPVIWYDSNAVNNQELNKLKKNSSSSIVMLDMLSSGPEDPATGYYIKVMQENLEKIRRSVQK